MKDSLRKSKEDGQESISNDPVNQQNQTSDFEDLSPEALSMREFQSQVDGSEEMEDLSNYQDKINETTEKESTPKKPNKTGIPDDLKTSVEQMSGYSLDDVKVHYNSDKPAELKAHAYAEGSNIYIASGQEKHLAHELWHVVQQKGGKVNTTVQLKGDKNTPINDDKQLEKEADVMGDKAIQLKGKNENSTQDLSKGNKGGTIQRLRWSEIDIGNVEEMSLTDSQIPDDVESTQETKDRRVFASSMEKPTGYLWYKESTFEIEYDIKEMTQYKVIDSSTVFYTAVKASELDTVKQNGIDPNYKNEDEAEDSGKHNNKGFNYFGKDKTSEIYGGFVDKGTEWQIISFVLPTGTLIERDPKNPNSLRTKHHIKPENIISTQSKRF